MKCVVKSVAEWWGERDEVFRGGIYFLRILFRSGILLLDSKKLEVKYGICVAVGFKLSSKLDKFV